MKADVTSLLVIFDDLMKHTNEERGIYWFKASCKNDLYLTLVISIFESKCAVTIYRDSENAVASIHFKDCSEIRVLDEKRKCLEIVHEAGIGGRCFISLIEGAILSYTE